MVEATLRSPTYREIGVKNEVTVSWLLMFEELSDDRATLFVFKPFRLLETALCFVGYEQGVPVHNI
jgi:hypothetical protein